MCLPIKSFRAKGLSSPSFWWAHVSACPLVFRECEGLQQWGLEPVILVAVQGGATPWGPTPRWPSPDQRLLPRDNILKCPRCHDLTCEPYLRLLRPKYYQCDGVFLRHAFGLEGSVLGVGAVSVGDGVVPISLTDRRFWKQLLDAVSSTYQRCIVWYFTCAVPWILDFSPPIFALSLISSPKMSGCNHLQRTDFLDDTWRRGGGSRSCQQCVAREKEWDYSLKVMRQKSLFLGRGAQLGMCGWEGSLRKSKDTTPSFPFSPAPYCDECEEPKGLLTGCLKKPPPKLSFCCSDCADCNLHVSVRLALELSRMRW